MSCRDARTPLWPNTTLMHPAPDRQELLSCVTSRPEMGPLRVSATNSQPLLMMMPALPISSIATQRVILAAARYCCFDWLEQSEEAHPLIRVQGKVDAFPAVMSMSQPLCDQESTPVSVTFVAFIPRLLTSIFPGILSSPTLS
jgi:hypothetical protein